MDEREKKIIHRVVERLDNKINALVRIRNRLIDRYEERENDRRTKQSIEDNSRTDS